MAKLFSKITLWRIIVMAILIGGIYASYLRFFKGLGVATNLNDSFPWGIWIGFDILCGVGLAAGGFTICAITYIFNIQQFKPLARPAILTAFLGYLLVIFALMFDLGRPWSIWHAIIMWNPHSVMFEVAWCVMLYTTVLFLEFSQVILEKFKMLKLMNILHKISIPLMIIGVLLSTLHQSSLGSLYLIVPNKMHPLWYSSLLPVFFYISAISVGLAMTIFESYTSARAFNKGLELDLLTKLGFYSAIILIINFTIRMIDITSAGKISYIFSNSQESILFLLEILNGTLIPTSILLSKRKREDKKWLYFSSIFILAGFLLNRLNVSVTAIAGKSGVSYFPSIWEINITLMIVVIGMIAFKMVTKYLPVFSEENKN
jgi:Ni/Fe-hydrogenase subunit HybB-like protein